MESLSQERLSEDEMESAQHYLNHGFDSTFTKVYGKKLIGEIKRLQAIEIQQKKVIEFCTTNLTAYGLKSIANEAIQISEGVDIHE